LHLHFQFAQAQLILESLSVLLSSAILPAPSISLLIRNLTMRSQAGWTQIEFISGTGKTIRGWVNNKEIQPLTPRFLT
jgi:hypothetical protein